MLEYVVNNGLPQLSGGCMAAELVDSGGVCNKYHSTLASTFNSIGLSSHNLSLGIPKIT